MPIFYHKANPPSISLPASHVFLHNSLMNILQKIFTDHFEEMIYLQHPRDSVIKNVVKMINCGNPAFGGAMYTCPCCGNFK